MVTIGAWALRDVATFFEAYQHPKDLGNRAAELARHVAFCESRRLAGEQLQYIQAFLKSWCRVPSGRFRRLCLHRLLNPTTGLGRTQMAVMLMLSTNPPGALVPL